MIIKANEIVKIYGEPLHTPIDELMQKFKADTLNNFLMNEARNSIGDYYIVKKENNNTTVVTSPGYSGGYIYKQNTDIIVSNTLIDILPNPQTMKINKKGLLFYLKNENYNFAQLPFTTIFKDIYKLPAGCCVQFDGSSYAYNDYLYLLKESEPPKSFSILMDELAHSLEKYFLRNKHIKVALMFSGGVDSLSIYLMLRTFLEADKIKVYTMEHSHSNGPMRALSVAKQLNINVNIITDEVFLNGKIYSELCKLMGKDIIAYGTPHNALLDSKLSNTIIFHGQNFDSLANHGMIILNETQELGYYSKPALRVGTTENRKERQQKAFMKNIQYTDTYLEDVKFQKLTIDYYASLYERLSSDKECGNKGVMRGYISSGIPNLIFPNIDEKHNIDLLDCEINLYEKYINSEYNENIRYKTDLLKYLTYAQSAYHRAQTFSSLDNVSLNYIANSGPMLSYFFNKDRTLSTASQPKQEIYAYIKKKCGRPYRTLIRDEKKNDDHRIKDPKTRVRNDYIILAENIELLNADKSMLLKLMNGKSYTELKEVYEDIYSKVSSEGISGQTEKFLRLGMKLINIEKILREVKR